jgi:phosphoglycerate kinase
MKDGRVTDETRIRRLTPTIAELLERGAAVVVLSHFGRPGGKPSAELSLAPLAEPLGRALGGRRVAFAPDCVGAPAEAALRTLRPGDVLLLENLRFHKEEEANDAAFARALAAHGDLYVNDAFSCAHRAHASTQAIANFLPAFAGRLMQAELEALGRALEMPQRPVAAIVGGAKISTKLDLLGNLVAKVDHLVIGGGMANTFLAAGGVNVGRSLCEHDMAEQARAVMAKAESRNCHIHLPSDVVCAAKLEAGAPHMTVPRDAVPPDAMILDAGPRTIEQLHAVLAECRTAVWNGPLGAFETKPFDAATNAVAAMAARLTEQGRLVTVAGGGDTVAALSQAGVADKFSYVSTAGGAFLEWLEGRILPGVAALERAAR